MAIPVCRGASTYDLTLTTTSEPAGGLRFDLEYRTDLFDDETVRRLGQRLVAMLRAAAAGPHRRLSELDRLTGPDRAMVTAGFNATRRDLPTASTALDLIRPDDPAAPAVLTGDPDPGLSYAELDRRANRLAHVLREAGVGPDVPVALCLHRDRSMLVALMAVWKAGGAYVPLDPGWPVERRRCTIDDAAAPCR